MNSSSGRILVTGSQGGIGRVLVPVLHNAGYQVVTLDRFASATDSSHTPGDVRDPFLLRRLVQGVDTIVHLGAHSSDLPGDDGEVLDVNTHGTWNVLLAAQEAGVKRIVYFSSINAIGGVGGHGRPLTLPFGDDHPHRPATAYQLSKHLAEEVCKSFAAHRGMTIIALRPTLVTNPELHYPQWRRQEGDHVPSQDLHAYVDVRDVAAATLQALQAPLQGFEAVLLSAADTASGTPTRELVARSFDDLEWLGGGIDEYVRDDPYRSLVDFREATRVLGFRPHYSWRTE